MNMMIDRGSMSGRTDEENIYGIMNLQTYNRHGRHAPLIPDCSSQSNTWSIRGLLAMGRRDLGLGISP